MIESNLLNTDLERLRNALLVQSGPRKTGHMSSVATSCVRSFMAKLFGARLSLADKLAA